MGVLDCTLVLRKLMEFRNVRSWLRGPGPVMLGLALTFLLLAGGCSHTETGGDDPESLFREAEESFKDEKYLAAIERYRDIKNRFPYSARATDSELRIADAYFEQELYIEAESAYEIFKELHPAHAKMPYVQYRIGLSYFNQIPSNTSRDLTAAYRAIDAFQSLLDKYPGSEYAAKAKDMITDCRRKLAEHEHYVADFYFRRRHFLSASYRYSALLQDFPNLGYDEEALFRLGMSFYNIHMFANARDALTRFVKQFPESSHKSEAQAALEEVISGKKKTD